MKKFLWIIGGIVGGAMAGALGIAGATLIETSNFNPKDLAKQQTVQTYKTVTSTTATTTEERTIPQSYIYTFDTQYQPQGACLKVKDADGTGYTYITVNDGTIIPSKTSCE